MIEAVIFDMDGVIIDSEPASAQSWVEVAKRHGLDWTTMQKICDETIGMSQSGMNQKIKENFGEDFPVEELRAEKRIVFDDMFRKGQVPVKPGITELLKHLRENNFKTAIASSTYEQYVRQEMQQLNLIDLFDEIVTGDKVTRSKPAPDIFILACETLKLTHKECIVIEDSYNGVRAAKAAGIYTIMIPDLLPPNDEMRSLADQILPDAFAVREFMEAAL